MQDQLKGKVVAITGAGSGIGKAIAKELSKKSVKVVLGVCRIELLEKVAAEIKKEGGK